MPAIFLKWPSISKTVCIIKFNYFYQVSQNVIVFISRIPKIEAKMRHAFGKWKRSGVAVVTSDSHAAGREFESRLGKFHSNFHSFGVDKRSTKITWDLNMEGLALGWPPEWDICCTSLRGPSTIKQGWALETLILHGLYSHRLNFY